MATKKLTKKVVDSSHPKGSRYYVWDAEVKGLGLRVSPEGRKVYVISYRTRDGRKRQPVLGVHGSITLNQARGLAREMLHRVASGNDPSADRTASRRAPTVADLAQRYLEEHARLFKKPSSVLNDERNLAKHVLPALGTRKVASITHGDIAALHHTIGTSKRYRGRDGTPGAANRVLALCSKMFNLAEKWGLRPLNSNPCRHITKYRERRLHRHLSELELARLKRVLADPNTGEDPAVIDIVNLILYTGLRKGEALGLRWDAVDLDRGYLHLADTKTGAADIPVNTKAVEVIARQNRLVGSPYVFPSPRTGRPYVDIKGPWRRITRAAGLDGLRAHDLRHNMATTLDRIGASLQTTGRALHHLSPQTTAGYAVPADDPVRDAVEKAGEWLSRAMGGE